MSDISSEELTKKMMEAVKAVEAAGVPEDLRVAAFEKAFEAVMGVTATVAPKAETPTPQASDGEGPSLGGIATRLGLEEELVQEVFYLDGEALGLALAASRLNKSKAPATQQIALLVAAGRQAGGWEEWTPIERIRDVVREYGRFDQANFASTVRRMGGVFSFRGKGRGVEVRVTRPGFERAAGLVRELGGHDGP